MCIVRVMPENTVIVQKEIFATIYFMFLQNKMGLSGFEPEIFAV